MNNVNSPPPPQNLFTNENYIQKTLLSAKGSVALPQTRAAAVDLVSYVDSRLENKEGIFGLL